MGKLRESGDGGNAVFRLAARAERRAADVDSVGSVQQRLAPDFSISRGGQQFKMVTGQAHGRGKQR